MKYSKKKILFITGTRADYGKLKPLMKAVEKSRNFELFIFVGGMHLLKMLGSTYDEVVKEGYKNVYIAFGLTHSDEMSINLGNAISHITGYVKNITPDMIVVHGDRIDALAGAIVGALSNITVAHIEGGEVTGTIDESIRHATSKFAHLHFVSNDEAKKRLVQLGEVAEDIFVCGSPDIDVMLSNDLPSLDKVKKRYGIPFTNYGVCIFHSVTTEHASLAKQIKVVVDALLKSNKQYVVIYPNNDLGSELILNEFERLKPNKNFKLFPSMRFEYFLTLLKNTEFIIGNSSAGIREAGIYGIPAIDIGTRQNGRYTLELLKNVQHVTENVEEIMAAITGVGAYRVTQMHFGKGESTKKFMEIIARENVWNKKLQKQFIDFK